ncbi:MAG: Glycerol-3-phosphate dehydrogenase [Pseudomonadota bacterium]
MNKIGVIGAGSFGLAICSALKRNKNNDICVFSRQRGFDLIDAGCNFCVYSGFKDLDYKRLAECEFVFLCMNSANVGDFFVHIVQNGLFDLFQNVNFVNCAKGVVDFDRYSALFLSDYFTKNDCFLKLSVLSGAGFADGIELNVKTAKTFACFSATVYERVVDLFSGSDVILDYSSNLNGVVLLGCVKNIIAIYVGYAMNCGVHINKIVYNILLILNDVEKIGKFCEVDVGDCLSSSAGIGDVLLTCLSGKSRNRTFGEKLAINVDDARVFAEKNCIEGLVNLKILANFALRNGIETSFLKELYDIAN